MLRKLLNGRRKFVTLAVAVLGARGAWILAQVGPQTVPLRVKLLAVFMHFPLKDVDTCLSTSLDLSNVISKRLWFTCQSSTLIKRLT